MADELVVVQADRIACARNEGFVETDPAWGQYLAGKYDNTAGVQSFAAHRIATEQQIVEWLRRGHTTAADGKRYGWDSEMRSYADGFADAIASGAYREGGG